MKILFAGVLMLSMGLTGSMLSGCGAPEAAEVGPAALQQDGPVSAATPTIKQVQESESIPPTEGAERMIPGSPETQACNLYTWPCIDGYATCNVECCDGRRYSVRPAICGACVYWGRNQCGTSGVHKAWWTP